MNRMRKIRVLLLGTMAAGIGLLVVVPQGLAAEEPGGWRTLFDVVMRWVNFAILAGILIKYGNAPIRNFLRGKREEIAHQIDKIEKQKEKAQEKIRETNQLLVDSQERFSQLKQRIIEEGEKKKQEIIDDAMLESKLLLEGTRQRIANQFLEAKMAFKSELAEMAVALAMQKLPGEITAEDNQKWVNEFIDRVCPK